jgi:hypothetical protein
MFVDSQNWRSPPLASVGPPTDCTENFGNSVAVCKGLVEKKANDFGGNVIIFFPLFAASHSLVVLKKKTVPFPYFSTTTLLFNAL